MNNRSRYVFGAALATVAVGGVAGIVERAHADVITSFTFETSGLAISTSVTGATYGPLVAESGIGSAYGSHTAAGTVYSSPSGNGSLHSFSANVWAAGDYYQFNVPTSGFQNIIASFDQASSATGPHTFAFEYSLTGGQNATDFSVVGTYTVGNSTGTTPTSFAPGTSVAGFNRLFDLSSVTGLNDNSTALFRIVESDTTTATGGTDRIDNVVISGTPLGGTPEPASIALVGVAGALAFGRRVRRSR
jgi:hypothetical protein